MWASLTPAVLAKLPRHPANGSTNGVHGSPKSASGSWAAGLADLERYRTYAADWDGQGATGIPGELIDSAAALASRLEALGVVAPSCVLPGVGGTVGFEWDGSGGSVTLEVLGPDTGELFVYAPGSAVEHVVLNETVVA